MSPHQQRVIDEKQELDIKLTALAGFFNTEVFQNLYSIEQALLKKQYCVMVEYSEILHKRVAAFK